MKRFALIFALVFMTALIFGCAGSEIADSAGSGPNDADDESGLNENDGSDEGTGDAENDTGDRKPIHQESDTAFQKSCAPVAPVPWPEPDLTGPSVVSFDAQLFFTVNGQRFFPNGFYSAPSDAIGLAEFKSEGFNVALTGGGCCGGSSLQDQIDLLNRGVDAGVMIILKPWSPRSQVLTRPDAELEAELDARTGVGGLFGWYTFDEPGLHLTSKELTERMHEVLSTYDPNHMDGLVDAPLNDFSLYVDDCAFFMVDPYPSDWIQLSYVKATMEEAWVATQGEKPIVGVMQAFSWDWYDDMIENEYHPNGLEMKNMAWQFIVHGASGLIPWNYAGDYTIHYQPEIWASYLETVAEMNELNRVILSDNQGTDLDAQTAFPTMFDYVVKSEETATWVLSVSTNERSLDVSFDLSDIGTDLCVVDYTTEETFEQDGEGRVEVEYGPLQVRILEIME